MLLLKSKNLQQEFNNPNLPEVLKSIIFAMNDYAEYYFGLPLWITSIYRKKTNDSGIHALWRAIDCDFAVPDNRMLDEKEELSRWVNSIWQYDPLRPSLFVCLWHKVGGSGDHFHVQVHARTSIIKP